MGVMKRIAMGAKPPERLILRPWQFRRADPAKAAACPFEPSEWAFATRPGDGGPESTAVDSRDVQATFGWGD